MTDYRFSPLTHSEEELRATSALLLSVFPRARHLTSRYLRWLYAGNPDGKALGFNAHSGAELVGHCAGLPLLATVEGKKMRGIMLVNAAVHAGHRRKNITRRTTDPMFEQAAAAGFDFAISTGNAYSTLPLLTRFKMLGRLEARIGVGLPKRRDAVAEPSFERVWDRGALAWRLANPERRYAVRQRPSGLAVVAPTGIPGVGAVLLDGTSPDGLAVNDVPAPGPLSLWLGTDPAIDWRRSRFVPIPPRLRASPLNLLFKDLTGSGLHPDAGRLLFRGIDFDAY